MNEQLSREDTKENENNAEVSGDGDGDDDCEGASGTDRELSEFGYTHFSEI